MDWFERLTGFRETNYAATRAKLVVEGERLKSLVNGKNYGIGRFELASLDSLRKKASLADGPSGRLRVSLVRGDVREMHQRPEYAGALFQVASQFNVLEMVGPDRTPEDGVTCYAADRTQGPACAIAAGAATIYRNYFADVRGHVGQTRERQLNGLASLGEFLSEALNRPTETLWNMKNGYALCSREGLDAISDYIRSGSSDTVDLLRAKLSIGLHHDADVTDADHPFPTVSQAFCSALPVAYSRVPAAKWQAFAVIVLEAAYEATIRAAVLNARRGASNIVLLTSLGGGAFGNEEAWINGAMGRALRMVDGLDLDVRLVSYGRPTPALEKLAATFA